MDSWWEKRMEVHGAYLEARQAGRELDELDANWTPETDAEYVSARHYAGAAYRAYDATGD